ncbi:hypothetical protein LTR53_004999 [Teratosphaeriaceae sp. CCFEE 6253]|nr:hypothetical protein LTR53_004999 [Teratosphaeriaceae sp. CCFEE 6253]
MATTLWKRQSGSGSGSVLGDGNDDGDGYYDDYYGDDYGSESWWWTPAGMAVRYAVVAFLFAFILIFFVGGYYHARRRLRKGLQPLAYHRWMVRRYLQGPQQHAYMAHQQQQQPPYQGYQMDHYAPPPPAYNNADAPPPVYQPPEGGSKVMADQSYLYTQPLPRVPGPEAGEGSQTHGARQ